MYTYHSGNIILDGKYIDSFPRSLSSNLENPHCNHCPVGAKCSGNIKALPNKDNVVMIRCPPGYCCQDDESCQIFDSCNSNRVEPFVGSVRMVLQNHYLIKSVFL